MERFEETIPLLSNDYVVINVLTSPPLPRLPHEIIKYIKSDLPVGDSAWCCLASYYGMSESEETIITQRLLNGLAQESENYDDLKKRIKNLKAFKKYSQGLNKVNNKLKKAVACELENELAPYMQTISLETKSGDSDLLALLNSIATTITQRSRIANFHTQKIKPKTCCKDAEKKYILHSEFKNNFNNYLMRRSDKELTQWYTEVKKFIIYLEYCNTAATRNNNILYGGVATLGIGSMGVGLIRPIMQGVADGAVDGTSILSIFSPGLFVVAAAAISSLCMPGLQNADTLKNITHQWKNMFENTARMIEEEKKNRIV